MRLPSAILALLMAAVTSAGAAPDDVTREVPVTDDFVAGKVVVVRGSAHFVYRAALVEAAGEWELCGALTVRGANDHYFNDFLRDSALQINGAHVVKDLRYWSVVRLDALDGAAAACRGTGVAVGTAIEAVLLDWSKNRYQEDRFFEVEPAHPLFNLR